jgi:hypothetical protein
VPRRGWVLVLRVWLFAEARGRLGVFEVPVLVTRALILMGGNFWGVYVGLSVLW